MIRGFARPIREVVALLAIVCICLTGIPAVVSAASAQEQPRRGMTGAEMKGLVEGLERRGVIDAHRLDVVRTLVAIANAPNERQRSALIRQLPVSISLSRNVEGRLVKNFFYRGKVRLSVAEHSAREPEPNDEAASGPHSPESSPMESSQLCYGGEQPPCATEAEMDELLMVIAYSQTEMQVIHDEVHQEIMFIECCEATDEMHSGPSATGNCALEGMATTGAALGGIATSMMAGNAVNSARAAGQALSWGMSFAWGAAIVSAAVATVVAYNIYKACRASRMPGHLQHWFEPVC